MYIFQRSRLASCPTPLSLVAGIIIFRFPAPNMVQVSIFAGNRAFLNFGGGGVWVCSFPWSFVFVFRMPSSLSLPNFVGNRASVTPPLAGQGSVTSFWTLDGHVPNVSISTTHCIYVFASISSNANAIVILDFIHHGIIQPACTTQTFYCLSECAQAFAHSLLDMANAFTFGYLYTGVNIFNGRKTFCIPITMYLVFMYLILIFLMMRLNTLKRHPFPLQELNHDG